MRSDEVTKKLPKSRLSVRECALRELLAWEIRRSVTNINNDDEEVAAPSDWKNSDEYISSWVGAWLCERRAEILSELENDIPEIQINIKFERSKIANSGALVEVSCVGTSANDWDILIIKSRNGSLILAVVTRKQYPSDPSAPIARRLALSSGRMYELVTANSLHSKGENLSVTVKHAGSLISALRELDAISSVHLLDSRIRNLVLGQGEYAPPCIIDEDIEDSESKKKLIKDRLAQTCGEGFALHAAERCNASQLEAVAAVCGILQCNRCEVVLVKGPPGTGKTATTAIGLNAIHVRQFCRYYEAVRRAAEGVGENANGKASVNPDRWLRRLRSMRPRLLVCAPTNVAIDNVVRKLINNTFISGNGDPYFPDVVRVGRGGDSAISASLDRRIDEIWCKSDDELRTEIQFFRRQVTLAGKAAAAFRFRLWLFTYLAPKRLPLNFEVRVWPLSIDSALTGQLDEPYLYYVNHADQSIQRDPPKVDPNTPCIPLEECAPEIDCVLGHLHEHLENWVRNSACVDARLTVLSRNERDARTKRKPSDESIRRALSAKILDSAEIVCATLHGAGHGSVLDSRPFNAIIIDEAANCVESATLVALRLLKSPYDSDDSDDEDDEDDDIVSKDHIDLNDTTLKSFWLPALALIGDPCQLPATRHASVCNWANISLFERLESQGYPSYLLDTQYRMHPQISAFPSKQFYQARLQDGASAIARKNETLFSWRTSFKCFAPLVFLNLQRTKEISTNTGRTNPAEAALAANVCLAFLKAHASANKSYYASRSLEIGIITFYRDQLSHIERALDSKLFIHGQSIEEIRHRPEVNTVDAFQGREKDVIIISCVRANMDGVGFLRDIRRLNVAITRAKQACIIIGHAPTLKSDRTWSDLLDHTRTQQSFINIPTDNVDLYSFFSGPRSSLPNARCRPPSQDPRMSRPEEPWSSMPSSRQSSFSAVARPPPPRRYIPVITERRSRSEEKELPSRHHKWRRISKTPPPY